MANEITISMTIDCINGDFRYARKVSGQKYDQAAIGARSGVQEIGFAAHEILLATDVVTEGWVYMRNVDDTNFVEWGIDVAAAFEPVGKMEIGEPAMFRLSTDAGAALYLKADTAAVKVEYIILED